MVVPVSMSVVVWLPPQPASKGSVNAHSSTGRIRIRFVSFDGADQGHRPPPGQPGLYWHGGGHATARALSRAGRFGLC